MKTCKQCSTTRQRNTNGDCRNCLRRAWRKNNPEKYRAEIKRHAQKHRAAITQKMREYRAANPQRFRAYYKKYRASLSKMTLKQRGRRNHLRDKYKMTQEDFEKLAASQGGHCKICPSSKRLCVDHNHCTGKVRGLLCHRHNVIVGFIERNMADIFKIAAYIAEGR